jgi:ADP-ribose pyrophosphatase
VVHVKPGVCVLALDAAGTAYLTEEFHYGVGRVTLEAVSGGMEPDEDALQTARRELREELGIRAATWTDLGVCDPFTASVVSPTRLFLARDIELGAQTPEGTELIRRVAVPFREAVAMVMDSRITHGPTGVVILKTWLRESGWAG